MVKSTFFVRSTAIGLVTVTSREEKVTGIRFGCNPPEGGKEKATALSERAFAQLAEYLAGKREQFDLPLELEGTPFQRAVWEALGQVPYGETCSYGEIAARIGSPGASRAVGMACNRNPVAIVVPCHRIVGKRGGLTGYAGGLTVKRQLLELEQRGHVPQAE